MRYFFRLCGPNGDVDREGYDFPGVAEARRAAVRSAGEYMRDWPELVCEREEFRIEVSDADGRPVFALAARCIEEPAP